LHRVSLSWHWHWQAPPAHWGALAGQAVVAPQVPFAEQVWVPLPEHSTFPGTQSEGSAWQTHW
jgi:hypothetical protein